MLITAPKTIEPNAIISCKLQSGQEIVGKVVTIDPTSVTLAKPLVVDITMDQRTGQVAIAMTPGFMLGVDWEQTVSINRSHITAMLPAAEAIKKNYVTSTTNLVMPNSGLVS